MMQVVGIWRHCEINILVLITVKRNDSGFFLQYLYFKTNMNHEGECKMSVDKITLVTI